MTHCIDTVSIHRSVCSNISRRLINPSPLLAKGLQWRLGSSRGKLARHAVLHHLRAALMGLFWRNTIILTQKKACADRIFSNPYEKRLWKDLAAFFLDSVPRLQLKAQLVLYTRSPRPNDSLTTHCPRKPSRKELVLCLITGEIEF